MIVGHLFGDPATPHIIRALVPLIAVYPPAFQRRFPGEPPRLVLGDHVPDAPVLHHLDLLLACLGHQRRWEHVPRVLIEHLALDHKLVHVLLLVPHSVIHDLPTYLFRRRDAGRGRPRRRTTQAENGQLGRHPRR